MHSVRRDRIIAAKGLPDGGICYELYRRKEKKGVFKEDQNMKYRVNDSCIGCGLCAGTCPEVFSMSDRGVAVAIEMEVPEGDLDSAAEAKEGCPVEAIEEE